jgi:hypothetical protein
MSLLGLAENVRKPDMPDQTPWTPLKRCYAGCVQTGCFEGSGNSRWNTSPLRSDDRNQSGYPDVAGKPGAQ